MPLSLARTPTPFFVLSSTSTLPPRPSFSLPLKTHLQSLSFILSSDENPPVNPHHRILEHKMNKNTWHNPNHPLEEDVDVISVSVYTLSESRWVVVLRLHTGACDRIAAVAVLRELMELSGGGELGDDRKELEVGLTIEDLIPSGKANKPFWVRGLDMLGYSLNSFRLSNLNFVNIDSPGIRRS